MFICLIYLLHSFIHLDDLDKIYKQRRELNSLFVNSLWCLWEIVMHVVMLWCYDACCDVMMHVVMLWCMLWFIFWCICDVLMHMVWDWAYIAHVASIWWRNNYIRELSLIILQILYFLSKYYIIFPIANIIANFMYPTISIF